MGRALAASVAALAACSGPATPVPAKPAPATAIPAKPAPPPAVAPDSLAVRVVADFEHAVLANHDAFVALFDFAAVGEYEILLHRYDLNGRMPALEADQKARFAAEDGTPYPAARERRNVGNFYAPLAQRTVGTGGCVATPPRTHYGATLGATFEPLPAGTPPGYELLRTHANAWLANGGVIGFTCKGGEGGLAVVFTKTTAPRGYDLITIYDD